MSLFNRFFNGREIELEVIKAFERKHGLSLITNLKSKKSKFQFLAKITEINFAFFFGKYATTIKAGRFEEKTPDWVIQMNGQKIICEVLRLNASSEDQKELEFEESFMETLELINVGCFLKFTYDIELIDYEAYDYHNCKLIVAQWLSEDRREGDTLKLFNEVNVIFLKYSIEAEHVCLCSEFHSIKHNERRLNYRLIEKAKRYSDLIEKERSPYIICLYLDFHSWLNVDDVFSSLYGGSCCHVVNELSKHSKAIEGYYSNIIRDALYYVTDFPLKNVTGILVKRNDEYLYFHNYSEKLLNFENKSLLLSHQYQTEFNRRNF